VDLESVSPLLNEAAADMERMAHRLEELLPAVRRRDRSQIAQTAVNVRDFAGPAETFLVTDAEQTAARFESARRRLLAALQDPSEE
jgi:hypothetical protein